MNRQPNFTNSVKAILVSNQEFADPKFRVSLAVILFILGLASLPLAYFGQNAIALFLLVFSSYGFFFIAKVEDLLKK